MSKVLARGIDVATFQREIDWSKVKAIGLVDFVIIRMGFRGYGQKGIIQEDKWFRHNIEGAINNGIEHICTYFFSTSLNEAEGAEEATWCIDTLKPYREKIKPIIVFDYEHWDNKEYRNYGISKEQRTANYTAFTDTINAAGYEGLIYGSKAYIRTKFDVDNLDELMWLAAYPNPSKVDPENPPSIGKYDSRVAIWQYSNKGRIDGINGNVDLDYMYIDVFNDKTDKNPYAVPTRTLYLGNTKMTEEDVKWLKWELNEDGYDAGVGGMFTKTTQALLRDYQFNHGLEVDGKCGKLTRTDMIANKA